MPAENRPRPKEKPKRAASPGVIARLHSTNNTPSASTGTGKKPNGAKPNTQDNPASNASPLLNIRISLPVKLQNPRSIPDSAPILPIEHTASRLPYPENRHFPAPQCNFRGTTGRFVL